MKTISILLSLALAGALQLSAQTPPSQIISMSVRGAVGQNNGTLISGFIINANGPKTVLIRGVGPTLATLGVVDAVAQANVTVYDGNGNVVAANDGYQTAPNSNAVAQVSTTIGAFPLSDPGDSALLATLAPGAYTVLVAASGDSSVSGSALLEVYDVDTLTGNSTGTLTAAAARGMFGPNTDSLIQGFVIDGTANMTVLIRGVGPDLSAFGIGNAAQAVGITVHDATGNVVAASAPSVGPNPDGTLAADVGDFPLTQPGDSAVTVPLAPGPYTVIATPDPSMPATGVALLEVYDVTVPVPVPAPVPVTAPDQNPTQPTIQSITADSVMLTEGDQTTIHLMVNDANGDLRFVNLAELAGPGISSGSFGSGDNFDAATPRYDGWNDIGTDTSSYQRDITLTFPVAGTYVFAGAAMDSQGNSVNFASNPNPSPTLTIVVNPGD